MLAQGIVREAEDGTVLPIVQAFLVGAQPYAAFCVLVDCRTGGKLFIKGASVRVAVDHASRPLIGSHPQRSVCSSLERDDVHPRVGPGLPLALGAAVATGKPTVVIQGDGGLMLSFGELATLVQQQVPVVVCVFNDGGYGILRYIQTVGFDGRHTGVDLATPDFCALAASVGLDAAPVRGVDEFEKAFTAALGSGKPYLLDIDLAALTPIQIRSQRPSTR